MENSDYIKSASSKELAARIVVHRLLGINKDLAIKCMEELLLRESNGDSFDFKSYIKQEFENSPKPYLEKSDSDMYKLIFNSFKNDR